MLHFLAVSIACLLAFGSNQSHAESNNPFEVLPFQVPSQVKEIDADYRSSWRRLTGFDLSGLHWNTFIVVYTNAKGVKTYKNNWKEYLNEYEALEDDEEYDTNFKGYPEGTVVLKENYLTGNGIPQTPLTITTMIKRAPGYDSENGDWEYIESDSKGNVLLRGNSQDASVKAKCSNCHTNISERDYIFSTFYSEKRN